MTIVWCYPAFISLASYVCHADTVGLGMRTLKHKHQSIDKPAAEYVQLTENIYQRQADMNNAAAKARLEAMEHLLAR